jgi:methylenetetrahydrofolate dehydrogenase (NADP+)/methenyltetrahydrofolate cyclohydrolase
MKIDGKQIASQIKEELKAKVVALRRKKILPHLAVVLVGNDQNSIIYIRRKQKLGEEIGVKVTVYRIEVSKDGKKEKERLLALINKLNKDKTVHGIIIQRPVPLEMDKEELDEIVIPKKDVDGFHPKSPFTPPVALAVIKLLKWVYATNNNSSQFLSWLAKQKILIIGRGETAGKPIAKTFEKMKIPFLVGHSQTNNLKELCLKSTIVISCVGKPNILRHMTINEKSIVIGVGLHLENGKLATDYNQEEIGAKAAYWTPIPGGVGPVNVACLFENLLKSCYKLIS